MAVRATIRIPMPIKQRAKQFMMFDAMKGLTEAISEKERQQGAKRILTEDRIEEINQKMNAIKIGDKISVVYYCQYARRYQYTSGSVTGIDTYCRCLEIERVSVGFDEIYDIYEYTKLQEKQYTLLVTQ